MGSGHYTIKPYSTAQMQRITQVRSAQTRFTRHANTFGQACKHVPSMAIVHVAFAFAYERVCLRVQTRLAW